MIFYFSAGVGRTGTFIAIDCVLEQVKKERVVDIAGTIIHLRSQRMKMVQSLVCSCNVNLHYAVCSALCPICRTMYGHVQCGFSRNYNILSLLNSTCYRSSTSSFMMLFLRLLHVETHRLLLGISGEEWTN